MFDESCEQRNRYLRVDCIDFKLKIIQIGGNKIKESCLLTAAANRIDFSSAFLSSASQHRFMASCLDSLMEISGPQNDYPEHRHTNRQHKQIPLANHPNVVSDIFYIDRCWCRACAVRFAVYGRIIRQRGSGNPPHQMQFYPGNNPELHTERSSSMLPRVSLVHPIYEKTTQK